MRHLSLAIALAAAGCSPTPAAAIAGAPHNTTSATAPRVAVADSAPRATVPNIVFQGRWEQLGAFPHSLAGSAVVLLDNGTIAALGPGRDHVVVTLFDPSDGTTNAVETNIPTRRRASALLLADGRVLFAGGENATSDLTRISSVTDTWLLATGSWRAQLAGTLAVGRIEPTLHQARSGSLLAIAGVERTQAHSAVEVRDGNSGKWRFVGRGIEGSGNPSAIDLDDGRVLVIARQVHLLDPTDRSFSKVNDLGTLHDQRYDRPRAARLPNGEVLVVGAGASCILDQRGHKIVDVANVEKDKKLYYEGALLTLGNGQVLRAGGSFVVGPNEVEEDARTTHLFDSETRSWSPGGRLPITAKFVWLLMGADGHPILISSVGEVMRYS